MGQGRGVVELSGFRGKDVKAQQDKKPRRRWLQFSLRGLLVLTVVVALGLGWVTNERRKVWLEDRAVEEIERLGGDVTRDVDSSSVAADDPFSAPSPEGLSWQQRLFGVWRRRLLGESYNRPVVCVSFPRGIEPEALGSLKHLRALWAVGLTGARIGDEQIPYLLECRGLTAVHLNATDVTDDGVKQLATLPDLDTLLLDHTGVTDDVLATLSQKALIDISIRDTDITPEGAARLAKSQPHPESEFLYALSPSRSHRETVKRLVRLGAAFPDTAPGADFPSPDAVLVMLHDGSISHHPPWTGCPQDLELLTQLESKLCIELDFTLCTKEYLQQLAALDTAEEVWLESTLPTREVGDYLASMRDLQVLHLTFAPFEGGTFRSLQDGELDFLAELPHLKDFALRIHEGFRSSHWTEVSQSALHAMEKCQKLKHLSINRVDIHEETLARIIGSLKLDTLYVGNTRTIPREVLDELQKDVERRAALRK